jgi:hypothetical protein
MRYACVKGCKPGYGSKARWHDAPKLCDFEPSYDPNSKGACKCRGLPIQVKPPEAGKAEAPSGNAGGSVVPPVPSAPKAPGGVTSRLEASSRAAEVVNTKKIIQPPQQTEFIVDAPHSIRAINFGFGCLRFVLDRIDDALEWKAHIPASQLKLSQNGIDTINMDAKNFYSKGVTRLCIWAGCRTQPQAHAAIDTVCFFGEFGGYAKVIIEHEMAVYKGSPKLIRAREKKKVELEAKRMRETAITTTARPAATA